MTAQKETVMKGYRTYLVAAVMVIVAGLHAQGYITDSLYTTLQGVLLGGGLAALRAGVSASK